MINITEIESIDSDIETFKEKLATLFEVSNTDNDNLYNAIHQQMMSLHNEIEETLAHIRQESEDIEKEVSESFDKTLFLQQADDRLSTVYACAGGLITRDYIIKDDIREARIELSSIVEGLMKDNEVKIKGMNYRGEKITSFASFHSTIGLE